MQLKYWALNLVESFVFIFVFYVAENNFYDLAMALVHDSLRLHITNEAFYIETLNARVHDVLVIDRINREISVHEHREDIPPSLAESKLIYGVFGVIRLASGPHLIVITERYRVGDLLGHTIWKIKKTEVLPYIQSSIHLDESQKSDNATYLSMLEYALSTEAFYFSTTFDLTHSMQRLSSADDSFDSESLAGRADHRFFWNRYALQDFLDRPEASKFSIPIMHGFVSINTCFVNGRTFDLAVISRRSTLRAGTRYNVRGLDKLGDAANFVETEQILVYARNVCSLVQTRGSIPLVWSQKANLKYKPKPLIHDDSEINLKAFNQHFDAQIINYGKQVAVNLVNHKGEELKLAKAFLETINQSNSPDVTYEAFDFHRECGVNRWDRLSLLMDKLAFDQEQFGYFLQDRVTGQIFQHQSGVFRTNCMDCLDRTNVVQSLIAKKALESQLTQLGIFKSGSIISDESTELDFQFKNIWADNGDYCSIQYAGTGALKSDFTRTGKRTKWGLLRDGYNSAIRYYKNNFLDGFRQDSIDLLLGNFSVGSGLSSPFPSPQQRRRPLLFFILYLFLSLFLIVALLSAEGSPEQLSYIVLWVVATFIISAYVLRHRAEFVNYPSLVHVTKKED